MPEVAGAARRRAKWCRSVILAIRRSVLPGMLRCCQAMNRAAGPTYVSRRGLRASRTITRATRSGV
ncbi:hypothetical protein [Thermocatellispora tengchongensis]|uniref:hypothetical protein n=1 Tax=Thermocatellispora tengchongensis TaxID=1073253 RepID=UPI003639A909